jgi:hypothetical protein
MHHLGRRNHPDTHIDSGCSRVSWVNIVVPEQTPSRDTWRVG